MASPGAAIGFLLFEMILFALASLTHGGRLLRGHENTPAAVVEALIAMMLCLGLVISLARPALARRTVLILQGMVVAGLLYIV